MKKVFVLVLVLLLWLPCSNSQNMLNMGGAGARAMGMGGAFTAVADDATAVYYNPAGLAQLNRPELSLVGYFSYTSSELGFELGELAVSVPASSSNWELNFASAAVPLKLFGRNLVLGGSTHRLVDGDSSYEYKIDTIVAGAHIWGTMLGEQAGSIYAHSGFAAFEVEDWMLMGLGLSAIKGKVKSENREEFNTDSPSGDDALKLAGEERSFEGFPQLTLGTLFRLKRRWRLGVMIKTRTELDFTMTEFEENWKNGSLVSPREDDIYVGGMHFPSVFAFGFAFRVNDFWTVSVDSHSYHWADCDILDSEGNVVLNAGGNRLMNTKHSNQLHLGVEYLLVGPRQWLIPLRLGIYAYPEPMPTGLQDELMKETGEREWEQRERTYFTWGTGLATKSMVFDLAFEFSSDEESVDKPDDTTISTKSKQLNVYFSSIYKF